ncbi:MAG: helix-turn-helix transcriptional regulator [Leptospirillum sp.]
MSDFKLITSDQLAQILGFSKKSIYVLASRGSSSLPPAFHVGKTLRWHPTVVQNWINQQAGVTTPSAPFPLKSEKQRSTLVVKGGVK